jgi:CPA2 family monovalent cation:H+ antiporter-2
VGRIVSSGLRDRQVPLLIVEEIRPAAQQAREAGFEVIHGNAADPDVIGAANLEAARCLLVAIPDAFEGGQVVAQARALNPTLPIIARSHSDEETAHLVKHGATRVIMGEHEIAIAMLSDAAAGAGDARAGDA